MGFSQARILQWVAISSPGDLPDLGMEPVSPAQLYAYVYPLFLGFPSHVGHHRAQSSVAAFYNLQKKWLEGMERGTEGIVNTFQLKEGRCNGHKMQRNFCFYSLRGEWEWPLDEAQ